LSMNFGHVLSIAHIAPASSGRSAKVTISTPEKLPANSRRRATRRRRLQVLLAHPGSATQSRCRTKALLRGFAVFGRRSSTATSMRSGLSSATRSKVVAVVDGCTDAGSRLAVASGPVSSASSSPEAKRRRSSRERMLISILTCAEEQ
jgi:hypothetical protein